MSLLNDRIRSELLANGLRQDPLRGAEEEIDFYPVVKLFTPDAACTWLVTELDSNGDRLFGLADLGMGCPELGTFSLSELERVRGRLGLPIEVDLNFKPTKTISAYASAARSAGRIVD